MHGGKFMTKIYRENKNPKAGNPRNVYAIKVDTGEKIYLGIIDSQRYKETIHEYGLEDKTVKKMMTENDTATIYKNFRFEFLH
jgi:hypothetical protein